MSTNSGNLKDASGTIAAGGATNQVALTAATRQYLLIHNPTTATEPLKVNFGAPATDAASIYLAAGGSLTFENSMVPSQDVYVAAATTAHAYVIKWA